MVALHLYDRLTSLHGNGDEFTGDTNAIQSLQKSSMTLRTRDLLPSLKSSATTSRLQRWLTPFAMAIGVRVHKACYGLHACAW